jgi:putative phage-type endonuclease
MALTQQQLEIRKTGIGGSDAGTVLGLNQYKTPLALYLEKRGEMEPDDLSDNEAVHFGNVLEDVVADEYMRRTGFKVRRNNATLTHPKHPFMLANLDRVVTGQRKVLEIKTASGRVAHQWGEPGTDEVPEHYLIQVAHYMAVTGYDSADLAVLFDGREFRVYHIKRDPELEQMLIEREAEFWQRVREGNPPEHTNASDVKLMFPRDSGLHMTATPSIREKVATLSQWKTQFKQMDEAIGKLEDEIKLFMGNAAVLEFNGEIIATWKSAKPSLRFDKDAFGKAHPALLVQYTKESDGARRFLIK